MPVHRVGVRRLLVISAVVVGNPVCSAASSNHGEWALVRRCLRSDVHLMVDVALTTGIR